MLGISLMWIVNEIWDDVSMRWGGDLGRVSTHVGGTESGSTSEV